MTATATPTMSRFGRCGFTWLNRPWTRDNVATTIAIVSKMEYWWRRL